MKLLQIGDRFRFLHEVRAIHLKSPFGEIDGVLYAPSSMLKGTYKSELLGIEVTIKRTDILEVLNTYTGFDGYVVIASLQQKHRVHFYPADGTRAPQRVTRLEFIHECQHHAV